MNYLHPNLKFKKSEHGIEFDVFIPSLQLAFEYQGEQHFVNVGRFTTVEKQKLRDKEKRELCEQNGITLIEIPFWWDTTKSSLQATIAKVRPDLFPHSTISGNVIPSESDKVFQRQLQQQEGDDYTPTEAQLWPNSSVILFGFQAA